MEPNKPKFKDDNETFVVVEEMPRFPGCEEKGLDKEALYKCSNTEMSMFIGRNLNYPAEARKKGVEGTAVVQFVVNKNGEMEDLKLIRDLGSGCGEAALKVMHKVADEIIWIAGRQRGQKVKVQFTLPIKFKL